MGDEAHRRPLAPEDENRIRLGEGRRTFGQGFEDALKVKGRAADNLEHIAGRGLVFDRLVSLGSAFGKLTLQIGYELLAMG